MCSDCQWGRPQINTPPWIQAFWNVTLWFLPSLPLKVAVSHVICFGQCDVSGLVSSGHLKKPLLVSAFPLLLPLPWEHVWATEQSWATRTVLAKTSWGYPTCSWLQTCEWDQPSPEQPSQAPPKLPTPRLKSKINAYCFKLLSLRSFIAQHYYVTR